MSETGESIKALTGHRFGQGLNKTTMVVLTGVGSNHRQDFLTLSSQPRAQRPVAATRPERQVQTRLTDAAVAQLVMAYRAGAKINQLATDFSSNRNTVSSILRRSGVAPRRPGFSAVDEIA
jgi:hypothetical protein